MKCKCCNASVTVEDEFCPYCGALNESAKKHVADMKKYSRDYADTKAEVMKNVENQRTKHGLIIAACILALLNILTLIGVNRYWDISYDIERLEVKSHLAEYTSLIKEYEENGQYFELNNLYNNNDLYSQSDDMENYYRVANAANNFSRFLNNLYMLRSQNMCYNTIDDIISNIGDSVFSIYEISADSSNNWSVRYFEGSHGEAIADIVSMTEQILKDRCGLSDEDILSLPDRGKNSIAMLIGERMGVL